MFNPDEPKETRSKPVVPPPSAPAPARVMSEEESFRFYLKESAIVLAGCGVGFDRGRPVVIDQQKLDRVTGWRKRILKEVWNELHAAYKGKAGEHNPPAA